MGGDQAGPKVSAMERFPLTEVGLSESKEKTRESIKRKYNLKKLVKKRNWRTGRKARTSGTLVEEGVDQKGRTSIGASFEQRTRGGQIT